MSHCHLLAGVVALCCLLASPPQSKAAAPPPQTISPEAIEFFETKVRPILVEQCFRCHSDKVKVPKGGLRVDSRSALLKGGDSGPALVPGNPEKSKLIEALGYKDIELQMPPKAKLPDAVIADVRKWVQQGAPWPNDGPGTSGASQGIDLEARKREHWAWRAVKPAPVPAVKNKAWVRDPIDAFILAKLEEKGLTPAAPADKRTWLRRVTFALIGLPPTPEEIKAFLADESPTARAKVVDRLLDSPHFGERWGRHWLDLVRYGETRGHEFEPIIPNAHQYRDYVIRAFNADVPYSQFVLEHLAGDLLPNPRRHPREGFNESILGTGFWFLGEEVHSPVDIRLDEADRFDNRIDVMSKTFLGLTVGCARCHDHKFDAIAQKDYYSLFGFLSSSSYRLVRFDSLLHNQQVAANLAQARARTRTDISRSLATAARPATERLADYLLAARTALQDSPMTRASKNEDIVFEDFEKGTYEGWEVTGTAFGTKPHTLATIAPYQGKINGAGKYFVNSHNVRNGEDVAQGDAHRGTLTSRPFTIERSAITLLVGGGAQPGKTCVNLLVDGKVVLSATGQNNNQMFPVRWDVRPYLGKTARIQAVDNASGGWGNVGFDHIVFTDRGQEKTSPVVRAADLPESYRKRLNEIAAAKKLDAGLLAEWVIVLLAAGQDANDPLHPWAKLCLAGEADDKRLAEVVGPLVQEMRRKDVALSEALKNTSVVIDYARCTPAEWLPDDASFGTSPSRVGDVRVSAGANPLVRFVEHGAAEYDRAFDVLRVAPSSENDPGALGKITQRAGRTLRTPTFRIATGKVSYLVKGAGAVYASVSAHTVIAGPLHSQLVRSLPASNEYRWHTHELSRYKGLDAHLEFTAAPGSDFAVALVVQGEPALLPPANRALLKILSEAKSLEDLATSYGKMFAEVGQRLSEDQLGKGEDGDWAQLANWLVRKPELLGRGATTISERAGTALAEEKKIASDIRAESRLALALLDGTSVDERIFIRGSPKAEGEPAPRQFLQALVGTKPLSVGRGSGRLELARQVINPEVNPFIARVMTNRIWHHLFGRGIVASVDNFGLLGEAPTHPELLDHLADRFVKEGWSVKKLIRELVLSNTYAMSSHPSTAAEKVDPANHLLSHMRLRRLEGEAIRDSLLSVSGRLDRTLYGPSVLIYLTPFLDGRGRPGSGPLDGNGRRSIYVAVRRNFLSPMLLAFDTPSPFSTVGRRTVSNVPAQALILMNDPFVHQQASVWARKVLAKPATTQERVTEMYLSAFGRPPTEAESKACAAFLDQQREASKLPADDPSVWTDLAHTLFNVKDFIFVE